MNYGSWRNVCLMQIQGFYVHKDNILYWVCLKVLNSSCNCFFFYYTEKFSNSITSNFCGDRRDRDFGMNITSQIKNIRVQNDDLLQDSDHFLAFVNTKTKLLFTKTSGCFLNSWKNISSYKIYQLEIINTVQQDARYTQRQI